MFLTPILKPWTALSSELGCVFLYSHVSAQAVPSSGAWMFLPVTALPNGMVVTFPMQDEVGFVGEILPVLLPTGTVHPSSVVPANSSTCHGLFVQ